MENEEKNNAMEKDKWGSAASQASVCLHFSPDEEEEQVADDPVSCFNCRYRRWTDKASFTCLKRLSK